MRKRFALLTLGGVLTSLVVFLPRSLSDAPPQDSEFVYARIRYDMTANAFFRREAPWHDDYHDGDEALPTILGEVSRVKTGSTSYKIVDIDSPELFRYPFAYLSEPGYIDLNPKDVVNLREYLDRGGFLFVVDFSTSDFSRLTGGGPEDDIGHFSIDLKKMNPEQ